eukprot:gene9114-6405_t
MPPAPEENAWEGAGSPSTISSSHCTLEHLPDIGEKVRPRPVAHTHTPNNTASAESGTTPPRDDPAGSRARRKEPGVLLRHRVSSASRSRQGQCGRGGGEEGALQIHTTTLTVIKERTLCTAEPLAQPVRQLSRPTEMEAEAIESPEAFLARRQGPHPHRDAAPVARGWRCLTPTASTLGHKCSETPRGLGPVLLQHHTQPPIHKEKHNVYLFGLVEMGPFYLTRGGHPCGNRVTIITLALLFFAAPLPFLFSVCRPTIAQTHISQLPCRSSFISGPKKMRRCLTALLHRRTSLCAAAAVQAPTQGAAKSTDAPTPSSSPHLGNATTVPLGPHRRVGNIFIVHCVDYPFKFSWEVNRMLRCLRLEFKGQTTIVPDVPEVRQQLWRVRHVVRIDMLDLDEAKALVGIPEHVTFTDLNSQIPLTFGRTKSYRNPGMRSKGNFMRLRQMRLRDVLHRDKLEKELLEERRAALQEAKAGQTCPVNTFLRPLWIMILCFMFNTVLSLSLVENRCPSLYGMLGPEKILVQMAVRGARRGGHGPVRAAFRFYSGARQTNLMAQASVVASGRNLSISAQTMTGSTACPRVMHMTAPASPRLFRGTAVSSSAPLFSSLNISRRSFGASPALRARKQSDQIQRVEKEEEEDGGEGQQEEDPNAGYLPFPPPFHTFNITMLLFLANILCYCCMRFGNDDMRDFLVRHMTLSRDNWTWIYPLFTNAFFQENLLQLLIDCWLLTSVGTSLLSFIGNARLTWLALLCVLGGSFFHLLKQQYFLYNGEDELVVRGRVYGPNTFIMGLIAIDGLIFRHMTFVQQPPIPYLVLTALVIALDVWRICTMEPAEHSAATGGAIMAIAFWALPIRFFGMDKLTAIL